MKIKNWSKKFLWFVFGAGTIGFLSFVSMSEAQQSQIVKLLMRVGEERTLEDGTKVSLSKGDGDLIAVTISKPTPVSTPKPVNSQTWKKESNFYTFELKRCKASGSSAICDFTVTNTDQDRWLAIHFRETEMFDDFSNQAKPSTISLGDIRANSSWAKKFLIKDIQIPLRIVFDNVSVSAKKITLLNLHCDTSASSDKGSKYTDFYFEFRDIPLRE